MVKGSTSHPPDVLWSSVTMNLGLAGPCGFLFVMQVLLGAGPELGCAQSVPVRMTLATSPLILVDPASMFFDEVFTPW